MPSFCSPYFWEDPRYLFTSWKGECASELINIVVFVYVIAILLGFGARKVFGLGSEPFFTLLLATVLLIPTFQKLRAVEAFRIEITRDDSGNNSGLPAKKTEGFTEKRADTNQTGTPGNPTTLPFQDETTRGVRNPFSNVMMDEYPTPSHNALNFPAAPDITSTETKLALDDLFRVQWYSDPTDVFGKTQSQRMFVTQPSTTIPNDQGSYQNWLYRIPGKTCKEGNPDACYGGSDGAVLPWLNL